MTTAKVKDNPGLVRDMETKAILTIDNNKYNDHRQKKDFLKKLMNQGEEFEKMKSEINEIKSLLLQLINK